MVLFVKIKLLSASTKEAWAMTITDIVSESNLSFKFKDNMGAKRKQII